VHSRDVKRALDRLQDAEVVAALTALSDQRETRPGPPGL
jgi:hypothetical protein